MEITHVARTPYAPILKALTFVLANRAFQKETLLEQGASVS